MDPTIDFFKEWVIPHWPWFAAAVIFGYMGVAFKKVITPEVAERSKLAWWFRATLPLHPVVAGLVVGALDVFPTSLGAAGRAGGALYYGVAGAASSYVYAAFQHFMEKRAALAKAEGPKKKPEVAG
jgi:hypothetical protein